MTLISFLTKINLEELELFPANLIGQTFNYEQVYVSIQNPSIPQMLPQIISRAGPKKIDIPSPIKRLYEIQYPEKIQGELKVLI